MAQLQHRAARYCSTNLLTHVRTWLQTARLVHDLDAEANEAATMNQGPQSVLPDKVARVGFGGGEARLT